MWIAFESSQSIIIDSTVDRGGGGRENAPGLVICVVRSVQVVRVTGLHTKSGFRKQLCPCRILLLCHASFYRRRADLQMRRVFLHPCHFDNGSFARNTRRALSESQSTWLSYHDISSSARSGVLLLNRHADTCQNPPACASYRAAIRAPHSAQPARPHSNEPGLLPHPRASAATSAAQGQHRAASQHATRKTGRCQTCRGEKVVPTVARSRTPLSRQIFLCAQIGVHVRWHGPIGRVTRAPRRFPR